MVTAVSGQLDTPGCYQVFNRLRLRTSNTEYWSHIPQDQGRRGGIRSGDCRIDYKGGSGRSRFLPGKIRQSNVVPKKGGKWRPVLNLKSLNQYVSKAHFKLEDIRSLKDILHQGGFMAKLDLKEAYLSVPMAYQSRRFLQFRWKDKLLQFTCLPFGLSSAPFVFTKLLRPVLASLRELGIRCLMYIDDMLILGETSEELSHNFQSCQTLMTSLGFVVNNEKSIAGPTQEIEFLGFVINSRSMPLAVTKEKLKSLTSQCKNLLQSQRTTVRHLAQVIGTMTSLNQAVLPAPLHYRGLQELRNESLDLHHSYDSQILLSQRAMTDLKWWIDHGSQWRAGQILISQPALTIESDASDLGWGATCLSSKDVTGGVWSSQERLLHINCKELLAAWLGLQCYAKNMRNCHVHLKIDNTAAVAYINKMGGAPSRDLCQLALQDVELVHRPPYNHLSGTSTRFAESSSGQGIEVQGGLYQMGSRQSYLRTVDGQERPLHSRPLCLPSLCKASHLLQLEIGSRGDSSECPVPTLGDVNRLCFPAFLLDRQVPGQDHLRECPSDNPHNSPLEITSVVPSHLVNVGGDTTTTTKPQENINRPTREKSSHGATGSSSVSRLDCVRSSLQDRGLSENAIKLICASWRSSTEASYSSCWRVWVNWCSKQGVNPINTSVERIIEFLSVQFNQGKQYSTLNSYRSSISVTHMPVDGIQFGKHPLISRLMKGVFHLRPPQPRYAGQWDVSKVLQFLEEKGNTESLSMKDLTYKLVMLMALANADRASDLCALDIRFLCLSTDGASFKLGALTKTARPDRSITSFYSPLPDSTLCPVRTLQLYLNRTVDWRQNMEKTRLFLSLIRPHHPVTSVTIARWLKQVLKEAGVSDEVSAHSTRATAVSIAFDKGVSVSDIMKTADWSSESVFKKYYYKPSLSSVNSNRFAHAVLSHHE